MHIEWIPGPNGLIAKVISEHVEISDPQSALDLLMNCASQGADSIILFKNQLVPGFFELRTGLAGEVLQKCSNYRLRLAIVGDFKNVESNSLRDFIRESNRARRVVFVATTEEAVDIFSQQ